jgi:hypothetical protein
VTNIQGVTTVQAESEEDFKRYEILPEETIATVGPILRHSGTEYQVSASPVREVGEDEKGLFGEEDVLRGGDLSSLHGLGRR